MTYDPAVPHVDCCLGNMSMASTRLDNVSMNRCYLDTSCEYVDGVDTLLSIDGVTKAGANLKELGYGG